MSGRNLTEPEAWREIARRIAEGDWNEDGLCAELGEACDTDLRNMEDRIKRHLEGKFWRYAYPPGTEPEARILAALWLALEAEEDGA